MKIFFKDLSSIYYTKISFFFFFSFLSSRFLFFRVHNNVVSIAFIPLEKINILDIFIYSSFYLKINIFQRFIEYMLHEISFFSFLSSRFLLFRVHNNTVPIAFIPLEKINILDTFIGNIPLSIWKYFSKIYQNFFLFFFLFFLRDFFFFQFTIIQFSSDCIYPIEKNKYLRYFYWKYSSFYLKILFKDLSSIYITWKFLSSFREAQLIPLKERKKNNHFHRWKIKHILYETNSFYREW